MRKPFLRRSMHKADSSKPGAVTNCTKDSRTTLAVAGSTHRLNAAAQPKALVGSVSLAKT